MLHIDLLVMHVMLMSQTSIARVELSGFPKRLAAERAIDSYLRIVTKRASEHEINFLSISRCTCSPDIGRAGTAESGSAPPERRAGAEIGKRHADCGLETGPAHAAQDPGSAIV